MTMQSIKDVAAAVGRSVLGIMTHNRMKSLYWRTGMMIVAGVIQTLTEMSGAWHLTPTETAFLGLALGEVSKIVNKKLQENSKPE